MRVVLVLAILLLACTGCLGITFPATRRGSAPVLAQYQLGEGNINYATVLGGVPPLPTPNPVADNGCGTVAADRTANSRFLYSQSYLSTDEPCLTADQSPCFSPDQMIQAPMDGLYSRFAYDLRVNAINATGATFSVEETFDYVAEDTGNTNGCATYSSTCPGGSACRGIFSTHIKVTASSVKIPHRMQRLCYSTTGANSNSMSATVCPIPFSYLPRNFTGTDTPCTNQALVDCSASTPCLYDDNSCSSRPCDETVIPGGSLDTTAALDANCGVNRDPDMGFSDTLNTRCAEACCSECPSESLGDTTRYQRWAVDPHTYVFGLVPMDRFLLDIEVEVSVELSNGTVVVRTVTLENADKGSIALDPTGEVRVLINDISAPLYNAAPDMSSKLLMVWDQDDSTAGFVRETSDPSVNPYAALPNQGFGLTPTITNLNGTHGWAIVNNARLYGPNPGQYGVSQETLTSPVAEFGDVDHCYDDFYSLHKGVPGWDASTVGVSACQKSHALNTLTADILAAVPQASWTGTENLPPMWDFDAPNWYIFDNLLIYELHPNAARVNRDSPGWVQQIREVTRLSQTIDVLVDVSEDLAQYDGPKGSVAFTQAVGCGYSWISGEGQVVLSLTNANANAAITVQVETNCTTTDTSVLAVTSVQPLPDGTRQLTIGPGNTATVPQIAMQLTNVTTNATLTTPPVVYCDSTVFEAANTAKRLSGPLRLQCVNIDPKPPPDSSRITDRTDTSCDITDSDPDCDQEEQIWFVVLIVGAVVLAGIVFLVVLIVVCAKKDKTPKDGDPIPAQ